MIAKAIDMINAEQIAAAKKKAADEKKTMPSVKVGDIVKVWVKIKEGGKERLQAFGGTAAVEPEWHLKESHS